MTLSQRRDVLESNHYAVVRELAHTIYKEPATAKPIMTYDATLARPRKDVINAILQHELFRQFIVPDYLEVEMEKQRAALREKTPDEKESLPPPPWPFNAPGCEEPWYMRPIPWFGPGPGPYGTMPGERHYEVPSWVPEGFWRGPGRRRDRDHHLKMEISRELRSYVTYKVNEMRSELRRSLKEELLKELRDDRQGLIELVKVDTRLEIDRKTAAQVATFDKAFVENVDKLTETVKKEAKTQFAAYSAALHSANVKNLNDLEARLPAMVSGALLKLEKKKKGSKP
jgi:hypothetical protein